MASTYIKPSCRSPDAEAEGWEVGILKRRTRVTVNQPTNQSINHGLDVLTFCFQRHTGFRYTRRPPLGRECRLCLLPCRSQQQTGGPFAHPGTVARAIHQRLESLRRVANESQAQPCRLSKTTASTIRRCHPHRPTDSPRHGSRSGASHLRSAVEAEQGTKTRRTPFL